MSNVISLWGGLSGEKTVTANAVLVLREMLEKAEAGEVIGVVVSALYHDGVAAYQIGGIVGGYSIIGAMELAKADVIATVRPDQ